MFWNNKKKIITISGMNCNNCAKKIKKALENIPEINKVKINLSTKKATIYYKDIINDNDIINKIEELEYKVTGIINKK